MCTIMCLVFSQSCKDFNDNKYNSEDTPSENDGVFFTSTINPLTRATESNFELGDEIGVFAVESTTSNVYGELSSYSSENYANNVLYSYSDGAFTSTLPIQYASYTQSLFFHAVYPYSSSLASRFNFAVNLDQSDATGYSTSDLMVATTAATQSESPTLSFYHKMSSVVINIVESDVPLSNVSVVVNAQYSASCDINSNTYIGNGSISAITAATNGTNSYKVIVAPQSISSGEAFVIFSISGVEHVWQPSETLTLKSGIQYSYDISISEGSVEFEGYINPWGDEDVEEEENEEEEEEDESSDLFSWVEDRMPIYYGDNAPDIDGCYVLDELTIVYCSDNAYSSGYNNFSDLYFEFYNFSNGAVSVKRQQGSALTTIEGATVQGDGENFTVYYELISSKESVNGYTITTTQASVISGSLVDGGVSDIYYATMMLSKSGDLYGEYMDVGEYRVYDEGDDFADRVYYSL